MKNEIVTNQVAVVVDGFSAGKYIPKAAKKRGINCIHIQSREDYPDWATNLPVSDYLENLVISSDDIQKLKNYHPKVVFNGSEIGTETTDQIAFNLGCSGNAPSSSELRRNKYLMQEKIKTNGLRSI